MSELDIKKIQVEVGQKYPGEDLIVLADVPINMADGSFVPVGKSGELLTKAAAEKSENLRFYESTDGKKHMCLVGTQEEFKNL